MIRLFFVPLFALSITVCTAQVGFNIFAGPQITSSKYTIGGKKQDNTSKYGFQAGLAIKAPFENKLYFSPAAFYSLKGYKVSLSQPSSNPDKLAIDNNTTIHTFELAALLQYDFDNRPQHFFVKFGPSLDFQLHGREKFNRSDLTSVDRNMVYSFEKYGRYGANFIFQFGYESQSGIMIFLQANHGIGNINNADFGPHIWHRVYGISLGKSLGKKNKP
ncbi:MAG: outer membrane beta-barrel protein [Chitinophagaceae bacterium]